MNKSPMLTVGTDDHGNIGGNIVLGSLGSTQYKYRFFWTLNNAYNSKKGDRRFL